MITLQVINDLIYDLHSINLRTTTVKQPTYELSMFRRCFVNLARRYTDEGLLAIGKYLNISCRNIPGKYVKNFDKISIDYKFSSIYRDLNLKLNAVKAK